MFTYDLLRQDIDFCPWTSNIDAPVVSVPCVLAIDVEFEKKVMLRAFIILVRVEFLEILLDDEILVDLIETRRIVPTRRHEESLREDGPVVDLGRELCPLSLQHREMEQ